MIKNIILILFVVLSLSACSDFLQEEPKDVQSLDQFFQTEVQAESSVNILYRGGAFGIYNANATYDGNTAMFFGYLSGFFENEYSGQGIFIKAIQSLDMESTELSGKTNGTWESLYRSINRANLAIVSIPEMSSSVISDTKKKQLVAEAKYFRAWNYYMLTRMFKEVPAYTEPIYDYEQVSNMNKSTVKEIYNIIVSDLIAASNDLSNSRMEDNSGRITKWIAKTLLSEVYLTMSGYPLNEDHYKDAANVAKEVINSHQYSLLKNSSDDPINESAYVQLRDKTHTSESIYYMEYLGGISQNNAPSWTVPNAFSAALPGRDILVANYYPVNGYLEGFESEDLRVKEGQNFHSQITVDGKNGEEETLKFEITTPARWYDEEALTTQGSIMDRDIDLFSYPDVLLVAAESIAQSGGDLDEAKRYIADVRERAYVNKTRTEVEATIPDTKAGIVQETWKERYRELTFEFSLWFDILRTQQYPNPANGNITYAPLIGHNNGWGHTYSKDNIFFGIPEQAKQANPNLR